jgi:hypothetical protein
MKTIAIVALMMATTIRSINVRRPLTTAAYRQQKPRISGNTGLKLSAM